MRVCSCSTRNLQHNLPILPFHAYSFLAGYYYIALYIKAGEKLRSRYNIQKLQIFLLSKIIYLQKFLLTKFPLHYALMFVYVRVCVCTYACLALPIVVVNWYVYCVSMPLRIVQRERDVCTVMYRINLVKFHTSNSRHT